MGMDFTLYLDLSSFDSGEDIKRLLTCEGAVKCLLRFLLLDADTNLFNFIVVCGVFHPVSPYKC
jgi:hypothetical protein